MPEPNPSLCLICSPFSLKHVAIPMQLYQGARSGLGGSCFLLFWKHFRPAICQFPAAGAALTAPTPSTSPLSTRAGTEGDEDEVTHAKSLIFCSQPKEKILFLAFCEGCTTAACPDFVRCPGLRAKLVGEPPKRAAGCRKGAASG